MSVLSQIRTARQHTAAASIGSRRWFGRRIRAARSRYPRRYLATWILLTAVTMLFAGLSSAYIVLRGVPEWQNITVPRLVWANTLVLLASSVAIEFARSAVRKDQLDARQAVACGERDSRLRLSRRAGPGLAAAGEGGRLSSDDNAQFVLLCSDRRHALHLAGGLIGLVVVLRRASRIRVTASNHEPLRVWALYWHFMDVVWIYCFLLLLLA